LLSHWGLAGLGVWLYLDETWNISEGILRALTQKLREITPGFPPKGAKMCFVFFSCNQHCLLATFPALISTIFETKGMSQCLHEYTDEKFEFCTRGFQGPKISLKWVISRGVCLWSEYSSNGTISGDGNHFGG